MTIICGAKKEKETNSKKRKSKKLVYLDSNRPINKRGSLSKPLRYHLRFQIIPGKHVERDAHILADFCKRHDIEEVVLFVACEPWNNGLLSAREENMWINTLKTIKPIMDKAGISVSLNLWMTILHGDFARTFPKDRKFKPLVSPCGEVSKACASFADPNWRDYIYKLYGRFAKLGFRVIWVEDDFRYHNHPPLTWGGGFEPEILNHFAQKVGRSVRREEVFKNILKPGKPHPWRVKWLETWREIMLEVAEGISSAVAANAPGETKIGLMTVDPVAHSIEGWDWQKLFESFAINNQVAHRPHYAGWCDVPGKDKDYSIMMLDVQRNFQPAWCEVAPEVENFPYTNWNKSDTQTWAEMALCMFYGSDALLLSVFPGAGNPPSDEPEIGNMLDKSYPGLEWISSRFSKNLQTHGVGIPWKQDAAEYVQTTTGESMYELIAFLHEPGRLLLQYGVPVSASRQEVNAVFGNLAWCFSDDEIHQMLSRGLLLDGLSADILCKRGFGRHIGVVSKGLVDREDAKYAVEVVTSKETGVREGIFYHVNSLLCLNMLGPREGAREWTTIITPERKRFGAGVVACENNLGGRVVTYAAVNPADPCLARSYHRQVITHKIVDFLSGGKFTSALITGGPNLLPMHFVGDGRHFVVVMNGSPDRSKPVVRIGGVTGKPRQATLLPPLTKPVRVKVDISSCRKTVTVTSQTEVPYLGFLVLEW